MSPSAEATLAASASLAAQGHGARQGTLAALRSSLLTVPEQSQNRAHASQGDSLVLQSCCFYQGTLKLLLQPLSMCSVLPSLDQTAPRISTEKRKEKTTPFSVNIMRSQALHRDQHEYVSMHPQKIPIRPLAVEQTSLGQQDVQPPFKQDHSSYHFSSHMLFSSKV